MEDLLLKSFLYHLNAIFSSHLKITIKGGNLLMLHKCLHKCLYKSRMFTIRNMLFLS